MRGTAQSFGIIQNDQPERMRAPVRYLSPRLPCGGGVGGRRLRHAWGNPGLRAPATISCHLVTEAPAFSVVADVAIVKGETPADDLTWLSFPDGTARRETVRVIHDLPHLVVESVFGLDEGLWGTLATQRFPGLRLVADAPLDDHAVAKAAVKAVLNRWSDGPDTPSGVRARLRRLGRGPDIGAASTTRTGPNDHPARGRYRADDPPLLADRIAGNDQRLTVGGTNQDPDLGY